MAKKNPRHAQADWRAKLRPDSRKKVVNKIMDALKRHLPVTGPEGSFELREIVQRFEGRIFR